MWCLSEETKEWYTRYGIVHFSFSAVKQQSSLSYQQRDGTIWREGWNEKDIY